MSDLTIVIPAFNEGQTIAEVVRAACRARLGPVLVVDDGSRDDTALRAELAGATVLRQNVNGGKAAALSAGLAKVQTPLVLFLDADLIGLQPEHVRALAAPLLSGEAQATVGLFTGGRTFTTLASHLTRRWSGQRALRRADLDGLDFGGVRYAVELAIEARWQTLDVRPVYVPLRDVTHRTKEEKEGLVRGFASRLRMFGQLLAFWTTRG